MKPTDENFTSETETDLIEIHRPVLREPPDPEEGRERGPWWLWVAMIFTLFAGGFYLGRFSGVLFENAVHVGYLRPSMLGVDPSGGGISQPAEQSIAELGPQVYRMNCISCHQANGQGVPASFPPLVESPWVLGKPEIPILIVMHGLTGPIQVRGQTFNALMPGWGQVLSDEQIAGVVTYVRSDWGNKADPVDVEIVRRLRSEYSNRTQPWTASELEGL